MRQKYVKKIRDSVKKTYGEIADEFSKTRQTKWLEFDEFLNYVKKGDRVLDIGCGNGRLYDLLRKKEVEYHGVDSSPQLIEKARASFPSADFQVGDMTELGFSDGTFDVVFSVASFHHLPGDQLRQKAADDMRRVLKKNGVLVLTVWNLFQWKYALAIVRAILSFLVHLGLKYAWNDTWIRWGKHNAKRYYHAFLPNELLRCFKKKDWKIEKFYFTRKGVEVQFWRSFNICLIARRR